MHAYKNRNTGDVAMYDEPHPELDALDNWETYDGDVPDSARAAYTAAANEVRLIAEAQRNRQGRKGVAGADEGPDTLDGAPPPTPTAAHIHVGGVGDQERILNKTAGKGAAVQIGPDPGKHPATPAECAALGAYQIENPPTDGVLARAKRDHKAGATQVGDKPEAHKETRAEARMAASGKVEAEPPTRAARKPELVAYAVGQGVSEVDAMAMSRDELAEKYGR